MVNMWTVAVEWIFFLSMTDFSHQLFVQTDFLPWYSALVTYNMHFLNNNRSLYFYIIPILKVNFSHVLMSMFLL